VENSHFGGILIRSLEVLDQKNQTGKTVIDGPSKCVDFILKENGVNTLREFTTKFPNTNALMVDPERKDQPLYLSHCKFKRRYHVLSGSRIGLSLMQASKQSARAEFVLRQYRYYTHPVRTKKGRNQMVASMYVQEIKKMLQDGQQITAQTITRLVDKISNVLSSNKKQVERYIDLVEEGRTNAIKVLHDGTLDLENMRHYFAKNLTNDEIVCMHGVLFPVL
jgi:hypothetical protein